MSKNNIKKEIQKPITQSEENDNMFKNIDDKDFEIVNSKYIEDDSIIVIDRVKENEDVIRFQETGDLNILEEIYKNRIPTIRSWANKHYYPGLIGSVDDLVEELSVVFVKAAQKYKKERGSFNTCLWTFFLNRLKNIKSSKYAKKRVSAHYDGPLSGMLLSLDYSYNDSDGAEVTLKDIIPSNPYDHHGEEVTADTVFEETVSILSKGNSVFEEALRKIGEGNSVASLLKAYKSKKGYIKVTPAQATKFRKNRCTQMVTDLIEKKKVCEAFKLVGYDVVGTRLYYEVELKKSPEADIIMKTIRELRQNKDSYLKRIRGVAN